MSEYRTVAEVAQLFGISRRKVYGLIQAGELETCKIGRCLRISQAAIDEFALRLSSPTNEVRAAAAQLVQRSVGAQGLDPTVTDPATLRRIAALLEPNVGAPSARAS